jgi:hypothetical protein
MLTKIYLASTAMEEMKALISVQGLFQPKLARVHEHQTLTNNSFNPEVKPSFCFVMI